MRVVVKLFANFREVTNKKVLEIDVNGQTLSDAIIEVISRYPALKPMILADGELKPYVNVFINGADVKYNDGLKSKMSEGDEVAIFPPLSGG